MDEDDLIGIVYGGASAGTLYQNRLVLAGGGSIGDLLLASKTEEWDDFSVGTTDAEGTFTTTDADGFWFQQTSSRNVTFHALLQQEGLFVFGDIGESAVPAGPFTYNMAQIRENSWHGSDIGRAIIIAGSQVMFLQTGGRDLRLIDWSEQQRKYVAPSALSLAGDVFGQARDMTFQSSSDLYADQVYVVGEDGRMGVASLKDDVPRIAWAKWDTQGRVVGVTSVLGETVFLVSRQGHYGLEYLDPTERVALDGAAFYNGGAVNEDGETISWADGGQQVMRAPAWMREGYAELPPEGSEELGLWARRYKYEHERLGVPGADLHQVEVDPNGVMKFTPPLTLDPGDATATPPIPPDVLEVGLPYERVMHTLPFIPVIRTGRKLMMRPTRIYEYAVDFVFPEWLADAEPAPSLSFGHNVTGDGYDEPQDATGELVQETDVLYRFESGPLCNVGRRQTIRLQFGSQVTVAGISYRGTG